MKELMFKHYKLLLTLVIVTSAFIIYFMTFSSSSVITVFLKDVEKSLKTTNEKPLKRYVYFDLGANIGDSARYFVDKDNNADAGSIKGYGAKNNISWEIYAIEANPVFNQKLDETRIHCEKLGHKVHLLKETAAWIKNEKLVFWLDTVNVNVNYWGSSLIKTHPDVISSNYKNVTVDGVDISMLLNKYTSDDEIIMKVDIEGAEYKLMLHLLEQNTLRLIDTIAVEFHKFGKNEVPYDNIDVFFKTYFEITGIKFIQWY